LAHGQDDDFIANGKPLLRIYSNYNSTFSNGETTPQFELERVYLGYEHNFSKHLYAKANIDVGNPGFGNHQMSAFIKYAYLRYRANNLSLEFGLISTTQFKLQESAWGYRYIRKSFQDEYKYNSSADLGISASYKIGKILSADVMIANGEGYKRIQADSALRTGFGVTVTPGMGFTGRVYYDFSTKETTQMSVAAYLGYEHERFSLGAEYMKLINSYFIADHDLDGLSFYTTVHLAPKFNLFARYDNLSSNPPQGDDMGWNFSRDGQFFMAGFEFVALKGVRLSPNYQGWKPASTGSSFVSTIILNLEVNF
jgi:hypothetical protein